MRLVTITIFLVTRVIITVRMVIITNIFLTRVIIRGLAAAADQRGNSVQLLGLTQDGRVEAVGQVLLTSSLSSAFCKSMFTQASGQVHVFNFCNLGNVYSPPCHHRSRGCCHQYQLLPYSFVVSIINIILLLTLLNRLWKEAPSSQEEVFQPHQDRLLLLSSISLKS